MSDNLEVLTQPTRTELAVSSGKQTNYHAMVHRIIRPEIELEVARKNRPLEGLSPLSEEMRQTIEADPKAFQDELATNAELLLRFAFPMLSEIHLGFPVDFSLDGQEDRHEAGQFEQMLTRNRSLGFTDQATTELPRIFVSFQEVRRAFRYLRQAKLLLPHSVISDEQLPWWLITAPVWFVRSRENGVHFDLKSEDPRPDQFVRFMAERLRTQRLADWYQIWNRRSRPFEVYQGDVIPSQILDIVETACEAFDYLVIATPYHHVASKEWADPAWQSLIDPYLLGFHRHAPSCFFVLGRWSNTGIFPLVTEMVAHTMAYLKEHRQLLEHFQQPYWATLAEATINTGVRSTDAIVTVADCALMAYKDNRLFQWLTEGRPAPEAMFI